MNTLKKSYTPSFKAKVAFYNHERLHQSLDYQTPGEIHFQKSDIEEVFRKVLKDEGF